MEVSTTPSNFVTLELDELRDLFVHEFGHVLGLKHCHDCDSAMNYEDRGRREMIVSDLDVRTFLELVAIPNGTLADASEGR